MGSPQNKNNLTVYFHVANGPPPGTRGNGTAGVAHAVITQRGNGATPRVLTSGAVAVRTWGIATERLGDCKVVDYGSRVEVVRENDETVIWIGRTTATGFATTSAPSLSQADCKDVLHLMLRGELATFGEHAGPPARGRGRSSTGALPPSTSPRPKRARRAATKQARQEPAKGRRRHSSRPAQQPEASARPARTTGPSPQPTRGRRPKARPSTEATAAPRPKRGRKPKGAAAPGTGKSNAPPHRPTVDDTAVLAEMKEKLVRDDPEHAKDLFDVCQRVWFAGGREATIAWMTAHNIQGVVDAFDDWMAKNRNAAKALLKRAQKSPKKGKA